MADESFVEVQDTPQEKQPFQMTAEELQAALNLPEETTEPEPEKTEVSEPAPTEEPPPVVEPETVTLTKEEIEKLKRKAEQNDKLLAKLGTEVGLLRKRNPVDEVETLQAIRDAYIDDPVKAMEMYDQYKAAKTIQTQQAQEAQYAEIAEQTRGLIANIVPDFDSKLEEIAGLLKADGYDDATINNFKSMPYITNPVVLLNLYKRNELFRSEVSLREQLDTLKKENETLKTKPNRILQNIEKEASKTTITAKPGVVTPTEGVDTGKPIHLMSTAELDKLLASTTGG